MLGKLAVFVLIFGTVNSVTLDNGRLNFTQVAEKHGVGVEAYDVVTQDGYILTLFRIPGNKTKPVLLMHGIMDSSVTFIVRGNNSLGVTLAAAGYDVWLGNVRGTKYSRKHIKLNPDTDSGFWQYSMHEMGCYDLPAIIDFVLQETGEKQLSAIGHSQGNQIFYLMGSERPEYNEKVKVMIALAPICILYNTKFPLRMTLQLTLMFANIMRMMGQEELLAENSLYTRVYLAFCSMKYIGYEICIKQIASRFTGSDPDELEPEFLIFVLESYPSPTSLKNFVHLAQSVSSGRFAQFDYGILKNLAVYNSSSPPDYDLSRVTFKVVLFATKNDFVANLEDIEFLRNKLPNVDYHLMKRSKFNHVDHIWGKNMDKYLFPDLLEELAKYNG